MRRHPTTCYPDYVCSLSRNKQNLLPDFQHQVSAQCILLGQLNSWDPPQKDRTRAQHGDLHIRKRKSLENVNTATRKRKGSQKDWINQKNLTITRATWCRGIQIHRAQTLHGHVDVVDMVKDYRLVLQRLIGRGSQRVLSTLWCLSSDPGGSNQLVASWWSSRGGTLEIDTRHKENKQHVLRTQVFTAAFIIYLYCLQNDRERLEEASGIP